MEYFSHEMTKKYVAVMNHIFSDIHVQIKDDSNVVAKDIVVPVVYGAKSKLFYELRTTYQQQLAQAQIGQVLPRMGFVLTGASYDSSRKLNNLIPMSFTENDITKKIVNAGVPYNFTFDLSILSKTNTELFQIYEQIVVLFQPDLSITIKEIPEMDINRDVSINLDGISFNNVTEFEEISERILGVDMTFTLKGQLYPRMQIDTDKLILKVITSYKQMFESEPSSEEIFNPALESFVIDSLGVTATVL